MTRGYSLVDLNARGDSRSDEKDDGHRLSELLEESDYKGFLFCFNELVFAVLLKSFCSLILGQTVEG